jgi:restriction system protein
MFTQKFSRGSVSIGPQTTNRYCGWQASVQLFAERPASIARHTLWEEGMTLWVVRSGKYGQREQEAIQNNIAVIGWDNLPDLSLAKSREDLYSALEETFPDEKPKTLLNWESQLWPFGNMMETNDIVVMPLKTRAAIELGRVEGPYTFREASTGGRHTRPVKWLREVPRSAFGQDLLYSFGSAMTICRVQRNNAEFRVTEVLDGKSDPVLSNRSLAPGSSRSESKSINELVATADDSAINRDLAQAAADAISLKINARFKGHQLSALIGAVLEAQGYKIVLSPPGADGGVDIVAGKGSLGFDPPRLVVQVKSQDTPVDVGVLRELQGVMRQFSAQQGLLVAWGGVTKALSKEAQRLFFEIRIWDAGEVVKELQQNYEHLADEFQADLPLKRIWVLADQE